MGMWTTLVMDQSHSSWCVGTPGFPEQGIDRYFPCQEETLRQITFVGLIVFAIPRIIALLRGPSLAVPKSILYFVKLINAGLLLSLHLALYFTALANGAECIARSTPCSLVSLWVGAGALTMAIGLHHLEHLRSRPASPILIFFWLSMLLTGAVKLRTLILAQEHERNPFDFGLYVSFLGLALIQCILENVPKAGAYYGTLDDDDVHNESPEATANIFSRLTFYWMDPLMKLGYRKNLEQNDLWELKKQDRAHTTGEEFQGKWEEELLGKKPSLLRALARTYGLTFGSAAIFKSIQDLLAFVQPMFLRRMMEFAQSYTNPSTDGPQPVERGFTIAVLMLLTAVVQTIMLHQYFHICLITGMRMRSAIVTAIYRKSLRLSSLSRQDSTVGEIVNLQSVDTTRLSDLCSYGHIIWSGPLQIALALTFLYQTLGPAIFAGLGVMILMIPVNAFLATRARTLNKAQMAAKDNRTKMMDEVLNGIKVIKLYAWEVPFLQKINKAREAELDTLKKLGFLSAYQSFTWACTPFLVSFVSFAVYTLVSDEPLTSAKVFVCISLFNLLQFPLAMFPSMISAVIEASVSFNRIYKFLRHEELDRHAVVHEPALHHHNHNRPHGTGPADVDRIIVDHASFEWTKTGPVILEDLSFRVKDGDVFAIVGSVGAGKSSLMAALLGEMYKIRGDVRVRGSIAYVPQTAWIMNATLQENILFGKPYEPQFYAAVIKACGLKTDLDVLPGGDSVEIGERGINLSGGQKQRVAIARAVYSRADIYLFDDPLSAVDAHVGRHIFNQVLGPEGILKDKARVLVTHGIHFLPEVNVVMMLQKGKVCELGDFQGLMAKEGPLHALMKEFGKRREEDDYVDDDDEGLSHDEEVDGSGDRVVPIVGSFGSQTHEHHRGTPRRRRSSGGLQKAASRADVVASSTKLAPPTTALMTKEESAVGSVSWDVYKSYAKACSMKGVVAYLIIAVLSQAASVFQNIYLANWAEENDRLNPSAFGGARNGHVLKRLAVYGAIGIFYSLTIIGQVIFVWIYCGIRSARRMHSQMLNNLFELPQGFFDTTPLGRILNRFSKDMYTVDEVLPRVFLGYFRTLFMVLSVIFVNIMGSPMFFVFAIPLGFLYYHFQRFYLSTSRELKRLDSTTRSPIYAHFSETLGGVSTIRAFKQELRFMYTNEQKVDNNMRAYYPSISSNRWLAVRLEFIGSLIVFGSALFTVITIMVNGRISAGIVGLMLVYSLNVTQTLNWMVRQSCEIETNIVSVERIQEYIALPREAPHEIPENRPPQEWPGHGRIEFRHYSTRYRAGLDLVLKDVSFTIPAQSKVGIVGRTGAGKSSLTLALFRLIEPATGDILIDSVDIARLGLHDLRSRLTIIPQDPVLFAGTVRDNLDPFHSLPDAQLWRALESASLTATISSLPLKLAAPVNPNGENFSVGQRQLICLARALLRPTRILILDEATAAIDVETDTIIQKTIRREFAHCTVLTIAHRIHTVLDCDQILVLDAGRVAELASPTVLLRDKKSVFYGLAKEAGEVN
ncbi:P-loop containing nucleoside triphosphate hydrolase protein [Phlyctochytrium arcticum]|nr:P-loop containing nucleoside triphosphate hydrolase protein [Phlyctochytrium arcticum]